MRYAAIIATYRRGASVRRALGLLFAQTVPPAQVIVVDASPDLEAERAEATKDLEVPSSVAFTYEAAERASLAHQRNQGIELLAEGLDVVMFLDDDSYLYPDCAEELAAVYEADVDRRLAGLQPALAVVAPDVETATDVARKSGFNDRAAVRGLSERLAPLWRHVLLMHAEELFVPYDGDFHRPPAEPAPGAAGITLFHGCRMTVRREVLDRERFDGDLVRYAAGEDLDFSYRVSRHGWLGEVGSAELFHHSAESGRLSRRRAMAMGVFNNAQFIVKHSNDLERDRRAYRRLLWRRTLAETVKDLSSLRVTLPQVFGVWDGGRMGLELLSEATEGDRDGIDFERRQATFV